MQPTTSIQKATGLETYSTNFMVWGYKNMSVTSGDYGDLMEVMNGYTVTYGASTAATTTSNTADWDYVGTTAVSPSSIAGSVQSIKYWDYSAAAYRFFAFAPSNASVTPSIGASEATFTMTADATSTTTINATPYYSALWFNNSTLYGQQVQMEFKKPFTMVRFIFTHSSELDPTKIFLKDFNFRPSDDTTPIPTSGSVRITYPLTGTSTTESASIVSTTTSMANMNIPYMESSAYGVELDAGDLSKWYYVLPTGSQMSYAMTLKVCGEEKTAYVPAQYMKWLPNYQYTYMFKITELGVQFIDLVQVGITEWTSGGNFDRPVYNW